MKSNRLWSRVMIPLFSGLIFSGLFSCSEYPPTDMASYPLIPYPVSVESTGNVFQLRHNSSIYVQEGNKDVAMAGEYLATILYPATGFDLKVEETSQAPVGGHIYLHLNAGDEELGPEGYLLEVTDSKIELAANTPAGLISGIATLRQLFPVSIESGAQLDSAWMLPTGLIRDYPEYEFRGAMLDVARHFFGPETVRRYIDYLAMYKFNRLHLHLSDDQGWRIEIKSWPNLTNYGSTSEVGGGPGGYFTQEEYKDLVHYAALRNITIIPEIDMPGHTNAALASYPELTCDGKAPDLYTGIEVGFSTFCTSKEIVYEFIGDVVEELVQLTPGEYFHIGGDESHSTPLEDYIPFVNRVEQIVLDHGKTVIGWDEISHADLHPGAIVQYWESAENAVRAIEKGGKVLVAPARKAYMDMKYDSTISLGLQWAAFIEVDEAYDWDPAELEEGISREDIIGIEAPLWSETLTGLKDIEYMIFPRLPGYAEIGWTSKDSRSWEDYKKRLIPQMKRWDIMDINYYHSPRLKVD